MNDYLIKQAEEPLFPDLLWDKPENKSLAGKLLIIGGNAHEFAAPAEAYQAATKAGVGVTKALLPASLQKTIGHVFENADYAPSNKSGSFARTALAEWISFAAWADATLLAGDLGRNSETAIVMEAFSHKYHGPLTITKDALDYFVSGPDHIINRKDTLIVASFAQLQKLASSLGIVFKFSMTIEQIAAALHDLSRTKSAHIITEHNGVIFVAVNGKVSTTKHQQGDKWRVEIASKASVWWLQNPNKPFEALTTATRNSH